MTLQKSNTNSSSKTNNITSKDNWFKRLINRLSIRQKIGFGYALSLGIAVAGTTIGHIFSENYQKQAQQQLTRASQEEHLLSKLQHSVLKVHSHQLQLIPSLEKIEHFKEEKNELIEYVEKAQGLFLELKNNVDNHFNNLELDVSDLKKIIEVYDGVVDTYTKKIEAILKDIHPEKLQKKDIVSIQRLLLDFNNTEVANKFDHLTEDLDKLVDVAYQEKQQLEIAFHQASRLGNFITVSSLILSIALAISLALYTSWAIASPLELVTKVAEKATKEANFTLQVPVTTKDEVGILGIAFNDLIQKVAQYTEQLEFARQTLEKRVEQRTDELEQKNKELESTQEHLQQLNIELVSQAQDLNEALQTLKKTQSQLIQTEKMSSLGQMVAGVAHEINNPVNFIHGNIEHINNYTKDLLGLIALYQQYYPHNQPEIQEEIETIDLDFLMEDMPKMLSSMKLGTERIRQIVLSLRNFSRLDEVDMKLANIHEGIDNTLLILNHRIKQGITVIKNYGELPLIECYPAQLNQVFMNILANGIDALSEQTNQSHKQITIYTELLERNQIKVRICDNGPGIPLEIQNKLFDPFFTTKDVGKGTGLGLSISYEIIEKHHGKIDVISQPGAGTEFAIVLPI